MGTTSAHPRRLSEIEVRLWLVEVSYFPHPSLRGRSFVNADGES